MTQPGSNVDFKSLPISKLFAESRQPISKLPVLVGILEDFAERYAVALRDLTALETQPVLEAVEQQPAGEFLLARRGAVGVFFDVPQWQAQIVVAMEPSLVVVAFDAMCGGDQRSAGPVSRALSALEQDVAIHIATAVLTQLRDGLADKVPFSFTFGAVATALDPAELELNRADHLVVQLGFPELGQSLFVGMPVQAFEFARERFASEKEADVPVVDPGWRRQFQVGVAATMLDVRAFAQGPPMSLGDVARLTIGSLVEFEPAALQHVRLECGEEPIFEGRLGQSNGHFTICVESPLKPASNQDEPGGRGGRRMR